MKYQGKEKTECGIMAKQRTQRNSTRKKTAIQNCSKKKKWQKGYKQSPGKKSKQGKKKGNQSKARKPWSNVKCKAKVWKETKDKSFDKKKKGKEKKECKEMNWKEENHIKEINNGKRSKTSSIEIWIRIKRQSKAKQVRARLVEGDRQGDKDTGKEKKAKKNVITKQIGNWKETTEKPFEKRRKHRYTFRTNNNKRKPADGESKSQPKAQQERAENSTELHCQKEKWKQKINKGHPN